MYVILMYSDLESSPKVEVMTPEVSPKMFRHFHDFGQC